MPCASRSLILNPIAGHTLVTDLESLAFMGRWIFTTLVGGVHQVPISTAWSCFKKCVTVVFGASGPLFDSQFGQGRL